MVRCSKIESVTKGIIFLEFLGFFVKPYCALRISFRLRYPRRSFWGSFVLKAVFRIVIS